MLTEPWKEYFLVSDQKKANTGIKDQETQEIHINPYYYTEGKGPIAQQ